MGVEVGGAVGALAPPLFGAFGPPTFEPSAQPPEGIRYCEMPSESLKKKDFSWVGACGEQICFLFGLWIWTQLTL